MDPKRGTQRDMRNGPSRLCTVILSQGIVSSENLCLS